MNEPVHLPAFLASTFGISRSEARRCIAQGGVKWADGTPITDLDVEANGHIVQLGRRRFAQLPVESSAAESAADGAPGLGGPRPGATTSRGAR